MPSLILYSNNPANPQTLDVSPYLRLQPDQQTDPASPSYTQKVWARSLLKEGATLALEQPVEKELNFPLALKGTSQSVVNGTLIQSINKIITSPGATASWTDDGMSQPTVFDILSGQVDLEYDYFRGKQSWCNVRLLLFTMPFGHTASARPYAAASGVGPLLMISPYASGGGNILTASATGFGASPQRGPAGRRRASAIGAARRSLGTPRQSCRSATRPRRRVGIRPRTRLSRSCPTRTICRLLPRRRSSAGSAHSGRRRMLLRAVTGPRPALVHRGHSLLLL